MLLRAGLLGRIQHLQVELFGPYLLQRVCTDLGGSDKLASRSLLEALRVSPVDEERSLAFGILPSLASSVLVFLQLGFDAREHASLRSFGPISVLLVSEGCCLRHHRLLVILTTLSLHLSRLM